MKLAKYKRYLRMAAWNEDIRNRPWVMIAREISIEQAKRMFPPVPEVPSEAFVWVRYLNDLGKVISGPTRRALTVYREILTDGE